MDEIEIETVATPELSDPVLVEGLPGVGFVGKLAVDHLVEELDSQPVRRIYSEYFPPAVSIEEGTATLASVTLHVVETDARDLLVLTGDTQAQDAAGQYRLAEAVLDIAAEFDVEEAIGLGGFGTGDTIEEYVVVGAVGEGSDGLRTRLAEADVEFDGEQAPDNIVGMSGLLVGLGPRRDLETAGLLGITPGYHVDPASARAVLEVLQDVYGVSVPLETLEEQAEEIQELLEQLQQLQQSEQSSGTGGEELRYFE